MISVVVSVLNGVNTLQRCLDSVATQTCSEKELIVIDGGSTDGTQELLRRNSAMLAYWESDKDRGIYHAWNKALANARGDWICFLGADDYLWSPDILERLSPKLAGAYPSARVVYGQVAIVNRVGEEVLRVGEPWESARERFRQIMTLPHPGLMHHRSLFEEHGVFDETFRIAGDYELLLRELRKRDALYVPDLVVAGVRHGGLSATPSGRRASLLECRSAQRRNGIPRPGALWIWEFAKAQVRVWVWQLFGEKVAARLFDLGRRASGKGAYWTRQ